MSNFDDLPSRHRNHEIGEEAKKVFQSAVAPIFIAHEGNAQNDYGTDYQLEVVDGGSVTNFRAHIQLKGETEPANKDGSVSLTIKRRTLNYLLGQAESMLICHHQPTGRLLVKYVSEILRQYEIEGKALPKKSVTVRLNRNFDFTFQKELAARLKAIGSQNRKERALWAVTPAPLYPEVLRRTLPTIDVPHDPSQARAILKTFFDSGEDLVISASFEKFAAVLDETKGDMDLAYMSEINVGLSGAGLTNKARVRKSLQVFAAIIERKAAHEGSVLYCIGNAHQELGQLPEALDYYAKALELMTEPALRGLRGCCMKNQGTALEKLGRHLEAKESYEAALAAHPMLAEAHMALGHWHRIQDRDYQKALDHFDAALPENVPLEMSIAPAAWKAEIYFIMELPNEAFREIRHLQRFAGKADWVVPWCCRLVAMFGRLEEDGVQAAQEFWIWFLKRDPLCNLARRELFMCRSYLHSLGRDTSGSFAEFKASALELADSGDPYLALIWDRVGHWAQDDGDWLEAEAAYRKAADIDEPTFGNCLGVALNHLRRFEDALPFLERGARKHWKDSLSWFHLAICREGIGDILGCIEAYKKALELEPDYALAWFNLGGIYWNNGRIAEALALWRPAVEKFPNHEPVSTIAQILSSLGTDES